MNAIVTIFKSELKEKAHLLSELASICTHIQQVEDAFIMKPPPGTLFQVLNFLKENKIAYGTHFDTLASIDKTQEEQ